MTKTVYATILAVLVGALFVFRTPDGSPIQSFEEYHRRLMGN